MMRHKLWAAGIAAAMAWTANTGTEHAAPAPTPGPGVIFQAVRAFVAAVDQGDAGAIGQVMTDVPGEWFAAEGNDDIEPQRGTAPAFFDVDAQGKALALQGKDAIAGATKGAHSKTKLVSMAAECPSGKIAFAVINLERSAGDEGKSMKMRATALLTEEGGRWKVFHWHASRA